MSPTSEPALPDEGAEDIDPEACRCLDFIAERALDFVRAEAARRDPRHAAVYAGATPARIKDGAATVEALLEVHLEFHRRIGRKARTGRRAHQAAIRDIVLQSNESNLVLAGAWLYAALGLLPPSRQTAGRPGGHAEQERDVPAQPLRGKSLDR